MASSQSRRPTGQAGSAIDRHVGQRLERQRQKAGISAATLAEALEVSIDALADWEAGRSRIPAHHLLSASQLLCCALTVFFEDFRRERRGEEEIAYSEAHVDWLFNGASGAKH